MKFILPTLLVLLFLYEADSAPIVRGIAPNGAAPGETRIVGMVVENIPALVGEGEISFGNGIRVRTIVKQSFQVRHERRMLFLQLEIGVDASAALGDRTVNVSGSVPNPASRFYVRAPEISLHSFKQISSDLIPWRLLSENLDDDPYEELVAVNVSPFADGFVDVIHPYENKAQRIYSFSDGHLVSAREAVLADTSGDGLLDLSILNWLQFDVIGGVLVRVRNKGDGTFEIVSDRPSRIADLFIAAGNFDGDRFDDTALVGYIGEIVITPGGGKPSFRIKTIPQNFRGEIQGLIAGDVNRDGYDDLVVAVDNEVTGKKEFRIVIANQDGTFEPVRRISLPYAEEGPWIHAISDLNNDGKVEFIFTTDRYRALIVATYSNGELTYRPSIRVECNAFAVGDIDADGDWDVSCAGSDVDQFALFRSAGPTFLPRITFPSPRYPVSIVVGDWNADRRPDLATGFGKMYFPHPPNERKGIVFFLQK